MPTIYRDRREAAKILAELLKKLIGEPTVVLSLPRGGVIVGSEIAERLGTEHDLIVTRKIGAPFNPEFAVGAVAPDGELFINENAIRALNITPEYLEKRRQAELLEIKRRLSEMRGNKVFPELSRKTMIVVDDGIATGFTMEAAISFLKKKNPFRILVAVPVGPVEEIEKLKKLADEVVCPLTPRDFRAVGYYYEDFRQVSDEEVNQALNKD